MKVKWFSLMLLLFVLSGCHRDVPEPEVHFKGMPERSLEVMKELPALAVSNKSTFDVQYFVKGDQVFVECVIPDVSFRDNHENRGKIIVYLDGKKLDELNTAAFILKDLSTGKHHIRLEVVNHQGRSYDLSKQFTVHIP